MATAVALMHTGLARTGDDMKNLLFLILVACGTSSAEPWDPPSQTELRSEFTDCADGATCVVVELGCCDACNGGLAVAVRQDQATAVADEHGEICDEPVACTEMACAPLTAECDSDVCTLVEGTL